MIVTVLTPLLPICLVMSTEGSREIELLISDGQMAFIVLLTVCVAFFVFHFASMIAWGLKALYRALYSTPAPSDIVNHEGKVVKTYQPVKDPLDVHWTPAEVFRKMRVFGVAGYGLYKAKHLPQDKLRLGIEGELATAEVLNSFVSLHPDTFVFHSVRWPLTNTEADIDHVLVCGNSVLLIDSKNWQSRRTYSYAVDGNIIRDGRNWEHGSNVKIQVVAERFRSYLTKRKIPVSHVDTLVAVYANNITIDVGLHGEHDYLTSIENLPVFLNGWREMCPSKEMNLPVLNATVLLLKDSPFNKPSDAGLNRLNG